jgi:hypothetical protein
MSDGELCEHRIERWNDASKRAERLACVEDYLLAIATYSAACRRWPEAHIILRGAKASWKTIVRAPPPDGATSLAARYSNSSRAASTAITSSATAIAATRAGPRTSSKNFRLVRIHPLDNPAIAHKCPRR